MSDFEPENRIYTGILYEDIDPLKDPLWLMAHAALNESEYGVMLIDEILEDIIAAYPDRFGLLIIDAETGKAILPKSTRNTLGSNMSTSPDFERTVPVGRFWAWSLTGTIEGVPRPDKKASREAEKKRKAQQKAAARSARRLRGAERNTVASGSTSNSHLISPYPGHPVTRAHPGPVPVPIPEPVISHFQVHPSDFDYNFWVQLGRPAFAAEDYSHPPTDHPEIPRD